VLNPCSTPAVAAVPRAGRLQHQCLPRAACSAALLSPFCIYLNFSSPSLSLAQFRANPSCFPIATTLAFPPRLILLGFQLPSRGGAGTRGREGAGLFLPGSCSPFCCQEQPPWFNHRLVPGLGLSHPPSPAPEILACRFRQPGVGLGAVTPGNWPLRATAGEVGSDSGAPAPLQPPWEPQLPPASPVHPQPGFSSTLAIPQLTGSPQRRWVRSPRQGDGRGAGKVLGKV